MSPDVRYQLKGHQSFVGQEEPSSAEHFPQLPFAHQPFETQQSMSLCFWQRELPERKRRTGWAF
jgi:hypothetical protein